jgi:CPA2 family monovalent cation:H+ antiporter-2
VGAFDWLDYREALLFLVTAGVVAPLFRRLRLSPVLGFLLAGALLGPSGLGALAARAPWLRAVSLTDMGRISSLAGFGVVFLLFMIGLELSFERLARLRTLIFGLGSLQVAGSALAIGAVATIAGQSLPAAAAIGAALSLSSTALVIPTLAERRRLGTHAGRTIFSVLLFQDLLVAPLLFAVSVARTPARGSVGLEIGLAVATAVAALALLTLVGRLVLRPLFHLVARARSTEFFVAACLLVVVAAGLAAAAAGLSMSLGAFVAGLLLAETEFRREVEVTIEPFKGLLLGLFFVSIGASLDLRRLVEEPLVFLGLAALLVGGKAAWVAVVSWRFRLPGAVRTPLALMLGPGGEFAFVMLSTAATAGLIAPRLASDLSTVVTLSMAAVPALAALASRLAPRTDVNHALDEAQTIPGDAAGHVLIVGYGRVGRLVGEMVTRHQTPFMAVDSDAALVGRERRAGRPVYYGDATRIEFLRRCGVGAARALVVTLDNPRAVEETVAAARRERPDLTIVARARDTHQAQRLYELGATDAVPETIEASLQLSEAVLVDIGAPMGLVIASIHEKRDEFRAMLQAPERERRAIRFSTRIKELGRTGGGS